MGVLKSTTGQGSWQETARGKLRALLQTGSALAVVLTLGACSSVPDAINPIEWGKSVGDMFDGEDEEVAVKSDEAIPGEDGEYPSLSDTPPKPVVTATQNAMHWLQAWQQTARTRNIPKVVAVKAARL